MEQGIYELGLKMILDRQSGNVDILLRPFGDSYTQKPYNKDKNEGFGAPTEDERTTPKDIISKDDLMDALNKTASYTVIDKTARLLFGNEKFTNFSFTRYMNYFVTFYLANVMERKVLGTKEKKYTHY